jgi:hypothetical protein
MPAHSAKTHPLVVANARHSPRYGCALRLDRRVFPCTNTPTSTSNSSSLRAQQFRDQLERWQRGELTDEQLLPLRLQNGWYIQRYAPMARIAVPYGEISSTQLRMLARIAREYDRPTPELLAQAQATQDAAAGLASPA